MENLLLPKRRVIEEIGSGGLRGTVRLTFIIKAINSINAGTFVVTTEQEEVLWVLYLIG